MTASLPAEVQQVFADFITTEYTTVDRRGRPICWPVTPYYRPGDPCIDVTTALGYPKKALDARANPKVALLFSDPTGCGLEAPVQVLVQGIADVDLRVRPERVFVWPEGDATREPRLFDAHMEEVRSGHDEAPDADRAAAEGGPEVWDRRLDELGERDGEAVLSLVAPDRLPFSVRVAIAVDAEARRVRV